MQAHRIKHTAGVLSSDAMLQLIVGAKGQTQPGWIASDLLAPNAQLDIRRAEDWARHFAPDSIDKILCESVLEHLTFEEGLAACRNFYRYLKPSGRVRIAVPDRNFRNEAYQWWSVPNGGGQLFSRLFLYAPDEPDHKTFYDYNTLPRLMQAAGFRTELLEWFDDAGRFHLRPFHWDDGEVTRSFGHPRVARLRWLVGFDWLSLIVDGFKR